MGWYSKVSRDINQIPSAIQHFDTELINAKRECKISGSIEKAAASMPGIVEHRFNQLQEVEAILEFLNIELRKLKSKKFRTFIENYNRALSSRDAEKFADGDQEVINLQHLVNEFALVRNKYLGLIKALDAKQFQLNNITKIRAAGLEDVSL